MRRSSWLSILLALAVLVAPLSAATALLPRTASAEPATTTDDEIILLTSAGKVRIDDPYTPSGYEPVDWDSGSDTGWTRVAAGDFNGDGDAEVAAAKSTALKVYDPVVKSGSQTVSYSLSLSTIYLLATGDFDGDGKDELAITLYDSSAGQYALRVYDGGSTGVSSDWTLWYSAYFGATWQDMAAGDFNNDGYADLALVRNVDRRVMVYRGSSSGFTTLASQSGYATDWLGVAGGNLTADYDGDEIALARESANAVTNALILLRVNGSSLSDIAAGANYKYNPAFASIALGDLNGDADDEVVLLRDPIENKVSLLVINPYGATMRSMALAIGYGSTTWKLVRTGDTDADGRDEIVVLRDDVYRIFGAPESHDGYADVTGSFYATSDPSNTPTLAVADVDGVGVSSGPTLNVSPTSLTFDLEYGQSSGTQNVSITNSGTSAQIAWTAQVLSGGSWLKIDKTSGVTAGTLGVSIDTSAVSPGSYSGTIRVSATTSGVANTPRDITVSLTVSGVALSVSPDTLAFEVDYGDTDRQTVQISSTGGSAVFDWQADVLMGEEWLLLSDNHGVTPFNLGVSVDTLAAGVGTHYGTIRIRTSDSAVSGSPKYVEVTLTVPDPGFVVLPSDLTIMQKFGGPVVTKNVTIWRPNGTVTWSAAALPASSYEALADQLASGAAALTAEGVVVDGALVPAVDWLVFTPSSGTTALNQKNTMTVSIAPGTPKGVYSAVIVVAASSANPAVTNPVQNVRVTGVVADNFYRWRLPLVP